MVLLSLPARRGLFCSLVLLVAGRVAAEEASPSCPLSSPATIDGHHHHHYHDDADHHQHHLHHHSHDHDHDDGQIHSRKLPEELAEEEDLALEGFFHHHHDFRSDEDHEHEISPLGIWIRAMGCSLLVSMASLICLTLLPVIFFQGKPSKAMVDCLAVFGAGAMLGDAFLHQLPHAFGGGHSHLNEDHIGSFGDVHHSHGYSHAHLPGHSHAHSPGHSHAHSLGDLSVGLSMLSGIVLFFLVEKIVRYVEDHSANGTKDINHGHHHHKRHDNVKHGGEDKENSDQKLSDLKNKETLDMNSEKAFIDQSDARLKGEKHDTGKNLRKRPTGAVTCDDKKDFDNGNVHGSQKQTSFNRSASVYPSSNLVFGYLNLFSDGVHNFTDGMALGSAFLLHGSVGGWSRTLFLLAHELPQEVGDFGILVRSGFSVFKALFFNFLSALVALAGTALALVLGKDPGHSSLIEKNAVLINFCSVRNAELITLKGFTAGGFIYIAVAGVLPEMNDGKTTIRSTILQLASLLSGMAVALCISLVE